MKTKIPGLLSLLLLTGCFGPGKSIVVSHYKAKNPEQLNIAPVELMYGDFGGLSFETMQTNAIPWKLVVTALIMHGREKKQIDYKFDKASVKKVLKQYGFLYPTKILNWDDRESLSEIQDNPVGLTTGYLRSGVGAKTAYKLELANITCGACHTGRTYDASGNVKEELHLGRPNTSLNVESYTSAVFESLLYVLNHKKSSEVLTSMKELFPQIGKVETGTYKILWPIIKQRINKLDKNFGHVSPYAHGGPGLSNGMGALKVKLKSKDFTGFDPEEASFISIPDLSQRRFKTSLLIDGTYMNRETPERFGKMDEKSATDENLDRLSEVAAFFLVPVMGANPKGVPKYFPNVNRIMKYLDTYEFQKFPGTINKELASAGQKVFSNRCTSCHGQYSNGLDPKLVSYPNKLIPLEKIGTDRHRADFDRSEETLEKINKTAMGVTVDSKKTLGYVAPVLNGLWASSPYLHNGSVPTLWHLMHPESRPAKFESGGHTLDFKLMGIAGVMSAEGTYVKNYTPWALNQVFDSSLPGKSNKGHTFPFSTMSEEEKASVMEFLKLL